MFAHGKCKKSHCTQGTEFINRFANIVHCVFKIICTFVTLSFLRYHISMWHNVPTVLWSSHMTLICAFQGNKTNADLVSCKYSNAHDSLPGNKNYSHSWKWGSLTTEGPKRVTTQSKTQFWEHPRLLRRQQTGESNKATLNACYKLKSIISQDAQILTQSENGLKYLGLPFTVYTFQVLANWSVTDNLIWPEFLLYWGLVIKSAGFFCWLVVYRSSCWACVFMWCGVTFWHPVTLTPEFLWE